MTSKELIKRNKYGIREWLFLAYFCVIFAHMSIPYLKFILFSLIILYNVMIFFSNKKHSIISIKNVTICLLWYGIFLLYVYMSKIWQVVSRDNADIVPTMVRILPIILCISYYINSKDRLYKMLDIFIISISYTAILALITTPIDTYGATEFRGIISLHRNSLGHICSIVAIVSYYLFRIRKTKLYHIPITISIITIVCTGSRGALLSLIVMFFITFLLDAGIKKKIKWIIIFIVISVLFITMITSVPYFSDVFGERFFALFSDKYQDNGSINDRGYYIEVGLEMFKQHPILGWGVDNFAYYLKNIGYAHELYSHNNYIEVLSSFGILGIVLYYWIYVYIFINTFNRKNDEFFKCIIVIIVRFFIFENATISFSMYHYIFILMILICGLKVYIHEQPKEIYSKI